MIARSLKKAARFGNASGRMDAPPDAAPEGADRDRLAQQLATYKHAFETTAADRDRLAQEVETYKHAFETTTADRDRLAGEVDSLRQVNANGRSRQGSTHDLPPQNKEPLDVDKIAAVSGFQLAPELELNNYPTLLQWLEGLFDRPDVLHLINATLAMAPAGSTIHAAERAVIYIAMRDMKASNSLEIGTYFAGTTQLMALAAHQDGGAVFSIDPYGAERGPRLLRSWPATLAGRVSFRPQFSTEFLGPTNVIPQFDFIFIDGDHRYPNVLHDLLACDENLRFGGLMVLDNAELPDVMSACRAFMRDHTDYEFVAVHEGGLGIDKRIISDKPELLGAALCFVVLRKAKTPALFERDLVYWITGIKELDAPPITIRAVSEVRSVLDVTCHMRYYMRDRNDPDCATVKYSTQISLEPGPDNHVLETRQRLPEKARNQILTTEIRLSGRPGDGSISQVELFWGNRKLEPNSNHFEN